MNFVSNTLIGAAILTALTLGFAFIPEVMLGLLVVVASIAISCLLGFIVRSIWEQLS